MLVTKLTALSYTISTDQFCLIATFYAKQSYTGDSVANRHNVLPKEAGFAVFCLFVFVGFFCFVLFFCLLLFFLEFCLFVLFCFFLSFSNFSSA